VKKYRFDCCGGGLFHSQRRRHRIHHKKIFLMFLWPMASFLILNTQAKQCILYQQHTTAWIV
jgi:hypothetical protein